MAYDTLKLERRGHVGWLIFNRPERLNALNETMTIELRAAWRELNEDSDVWVIVHTGEGRAFSSGMDLKETSAEGMERFRKNTENFDLGISAYHNKVWKPVIVAVNGVCAGAGFHWVTDADIVIAASDATFVDPHVSVGQVSVFESIGLMSRIPPGAALRIALVGAHERLSAQRMYELGLVSEVIDPPERLREAAQELAEKVARNSPSALRLTKRAMWRAFEMGRSSAEAIGAKDQVAFWSHPDNMEGPRSFAEKREPRWLPPTGDLE